MTQDEREETVRALLRAIGEDPEREGLRDTPARVVRSWRELFAGYAPDGAKVLERTFDVGEYDQLVVVRGVPFFSFCEHHMLPFYGEVAVGYLPTDRVVGLSKLPRIVQHFAKRLQVQERMTRQIGEAIQERLRPLACGVVVRGVHTCMVARGVRAAGAEMVTSHLTGSFRNEPALRAEFLDLAKGRP